MSDTATDRHDPDPEPDAPARGVDSSDRARDGREPPRPRSRTGSAVPGSSRATVETDVPPDAPAAVCDRCGRPFASGTYLALHRGLAHDDDLTDDERAAYEAALDDEVDQLRRFRILALGALVLLYFGFLFAYAVFT